MSKSMFAKAVFLKPGNFSLYRNYQINRWSQQADLLSVSIVFYDAACPMCRVQMQRLHRRDRYQRLVLIDINSPAFNEQTWGLSYEQLSRALHVMTPSNEYLVGMPAIRHIYERLGLAGWWACTRWPLIGPLADLAYRYVARHRLQISHCLGWNEGTALCVDGLCDNARQGSREWHLFKK